MNVLRAALRRVPYLPSLKRAFPGSRAASPEPGHAVIGRYLASLAPGTPVRVAFGGHWSNNPGWLLLAEEHQDVTAPLAFADASVDIVFAEHVLEHVSLPGAVSFLREAYRILKPGGVCRIICPMLDPLMNADLSGANGRRYIRNSLLPHFSEEQRSLANLGLDGIDDDPLPFLFASMYMGHGHRFIWTTGLMTKVMTAIGFTDACRAEVGRGRRPEACIERRRRGVYLGYDWREELAADESVDVESGIVEATK